MSTRTMIIFSYTKNDKIDRGIPIYKHSDGYPSNVLHLLRCYLWVNRARLNDISYLSAGFLRYCENYRNESEIPERFKNVDENNFFNSDPYTGFGLYEMEIKGSILDGWEEYYYKITPEMIYVYDSQNMEKMYEVSIEKLFEMPEEPEYYEELQNKIFSEFYDDGI